MQDRDRQNFNRTFLEMASCYPTAKLDPANQEAYWLRLKSYNLAAVRTGMVRATSDSPEFFPTAIQVEEHAKAAEKAGAGTKPNYELKAIAGATEKIRGLPPDNPFEILARKSERENLLGNPDCSGPAKELRALLDGAKGPLVRELVPECEDWSDRRTGEKKDEAA